MKRIIDDIHTFKGNVLCIGVADDKILSCLKKNKLIGLYELNRNSTTKIFGRKKVKDNSGKSIPIKKFRKVFKKKSLEYIIINLNSVFDYQKYMASNAVYLCKKKLYIYGTSEMINASYVARKYKRYNTKIECLEDGSDYCVVVDLSKAKFSWFKEKFYLIVDTFINLGDMITYLLTS